MFAFDFDTRGHYFENQTVTGKTLLSINKPDCLYPKTLRFTRYSKRLSFSVSISQLNQAVSKRKDFALKISRSPYFDNLLSESIQTCTIGTL